MLIRLKLYLKEQKGIKMPLNEIDGKPIINAKKPIKLTINNNDINKADVKKPDDCAVARACRRELHVKEVRVHLGCVYLRYNEGNWVRLRYMTPRSLRAEIIAFDRGGKFEPGEYQLNAIPPSRKTGKAQGSLKNKTKPKKLQKKRLKAHIVTNVRMGPA